MKIQSSWTDVEGLRIHYLKAGRNSPVILLHGWANDAQEWKFNMESLSQFHQVYVPDMVGYGQSDKPEAEYKISFFVNFLNNFMKALKLEHTSLIGHSLGGGIALDFAVSFPSKVDKLILVDGPAIEEKTTFWCKIVPLLTLWKALKEQKAYSYLVKHMKGLKKEQAAFIDMLSRVNSPTLILWGKKDRYLPLLNAYKMHELIKNSKLYIFENCGHAPQREGAEEFNKIVSDFLIHS
jgi:4,5:9,10-diseco-3-hydroxy-5,9,17-trioxoandrosta-1(10),2-diene-4-oate hydrolase